MRSSNVFRGPGGRRGRRSRRWLSVALTAVLVASIAAADLSLPNASTPAFAADPVTPPSAVNPTDFIRPVTAAGPTVAPARITVDTVWGPEGSPYVIRGKLYVDASLTMLPGTVVKVDGPTSGITVMDVGQLLILGSWDSRVVVTSYKDDTVMGDTNGDGSASAPVPGDWQSITVSGVYGTSTASLKTPPTVIDYAEVRFGGNKHGRALW